MRTSLIGKGGKKHMHTISSILMDIDRGCLANNMVENKFSYRIVYLVNESNSSFKYSIDTPYSGLREALENIIRNNLSLTNSVVISEITVQKDEDLISLQSRPYSFSLDGYFRQIKGECRDKKNNKNIMYSRYAVR